MKHLNSLFKQTRLLIRASHDPLGRIQRIVRLHEGHQFLQIHANLTVPLISDQRIHTANLEIIRMPRQLYPIWEVEEN